LIHLFLETLASLKFAKQIGGCDKCAIEQRFRMIDKNSQQKTGENLVQSTEMTETVPKEKFKMLRAKDPINALQVDLKFLVV
jgi:hypothetical protein